MKLAITLEPGDVVSAGAPANAVVAGWRTGG